ncbi:zinc-finger associated domain (zf-AD) domain-containing protein [Phthorimaea operculella]|nr:zinc-finger associated domain (zf-AD) domain-containing protein [Phthorimaea operculella]
MLCTSYAEVPNLADAADLNLCGRDHSTYVQTCSCKVDYGLRHWNAGGRTCPRRDESADSIHVQIQADHGWPSHEVLSLQFDPSKTTAEDQYKAGLQHRTSTSVLTHRGQGNKINMDLNNLRSDLQACRVCLATDIKLISLQDLNLKRMYSEFSGVPIMASDGLPQHICVFCCAMLKKSSKFRKKCEAAYYLLLQHFLEKKGLTSSYVNTIDRSHLRMTMSTTAAIHCNCIPDTLFSIGVEELKEENETELTADECLTFEDELNETKPTLVGEPKFNINQDVSIYNRNSGKSNRCIPSTVLLDKVVLYKETIKQSKQIGCNKKKGRKVNSAIAERQQNDVEERIYYYKTMFFNKGVDPDKELFYMYIIDKYLIQTETEKKYNWVFKNSFHDAVEMPDFIKIDTHNVKYSRTEVNSIIEICNNTQNVTRKRLYEFVNNKYISNNVSTKNQKYVKDISEMREKGIKSSRESFEKSCKQYNFDAILMLKNEKFDDVLKRKESASYKMAKYKCELCYRGFATENTFQNHKAQHDPTRPYECEFCHVRFKDTSTRYQHLVRHRQKLVCRQCGQVVRDMTTAREHYKSHSGVGFDCEHCGKKFDKYGSRINHIRIHHGNVSCDICHMKFTGELGLRGHKARAHLELFKCPSCLVQFHNPNALRRHAEATENGCGPHIRPCTQCGDSFYDDLQLKEHMFAMHLYDKNARREDYCNPHKTTIRRRRGEKQAPLICEMCGKEFKFEYALRDHKQRVHSEETPFVCDYCNKAFKSRPQIQFHISNVHSGRRYSCPHCSKAFRQAGHLAAHKLTHSTEKNFSCNICEIRFKHFSSMREHERIIHEGKPARKRGRKVKK